MLDISAFYKRFVIAFIVFTIFGVVSYAIEGDRGEFVELELSGILAFCVGFMSYFLMTRFTDLQESDKSFVSTTLGLIALTMAYPPYRDGWVLYGTAIWSVALLIYLVHMKLR